MVSRGLERMVDAHEYHIMNISYMFCFSSFNFLFVNAQIEAHNPNKSEMFKGSVERLCGCELRRENLLNPASASISVS